MLKSLPPIILWELWGSRCSSEYEPERSSVARSISLITFNIINKVKAKFGRISIGDNWIEVCNRCNHSLNEVSVILVKWIKHLILFLKLNNDGSCIDGICGAGGVVRDSRGRMLMAYILPLGLGTSNWAESCALLFGLKWCIQRGNRLIIGEIDSLILHNCISGNWSILWRIADCIRELRIMVEEHGIVTRHRFREANKVADKLAFMSHSTEEVCIYTEFDTLSRQIRGLLNADRWQLPSFRVKRRRSSLLTYESP